MEKGDPGDMRVSDRHEQLHQTLLRDCDEDKTGISLLT